MKIEFEIEESRELFVFLSDRVLKEAGLGAKDLAAVRKWRNDSMRAGSQGMRDLHDRMNADLARVLETKKRSSVRKPDWR
jgi:hypothetical protein